MDEYKTINKTGIGSRILKRRFMQQSKKKNLPRVILPWKILSWIWLGLVFIICIIYLNGQVTSHLDADMSSEMVLARLLSEERKILSENWYYSTELRVVNIQLVAGFFFSLFDNWHLVRMCTTVALLIIMMVTFYYLCLQMGCRNYYPIAGSILLMPFCDDYYEFVLSGLYYIPHISFSFISFGLVFHYGKTTKKGQQAAILAASFLVSLLATLGGARQIFVTYLPLLLASFLGIILLIRKSRNARSLDRSEDDKTIWKSNYVAYMISSLFFFAGCLIGLRINTAFLAGKYHFRNYSSLSWTEFSWEGLINVVHGFFSFFGFSTGRVMGGITARNASCFLMVFLFIKYAIKKIREKKDDIPPFLILSLIAGMVCYVILYTFTDMEYKQRYILPIMILTVPLLACGIKSVCKGNKVAAGRAEFYLIGGVLLCISLSSMLYFKEKAEVDETARLREVVEILVEEEYGTGYSTFWQANLITELSNGRIDMYDWFDVNSQKDLIDVDTVYEWLQVKQHHEPPEGKVFLLFTTDEFKTFTLCKALKQNEALTITDEYVVFGFDDYEAMKEELSE